MYINIWSSYEVKNEGVVIVCTSVYRNIKQAVDLFASKLKEKG